MKIQSINSFNGLTDRRQQKPSFGRNWSEHVSWGANYMKETGKTNFKMFSFPDAKGVFVEVADKAVAGVSNIRERIVQVLATMGTAFSIKEIIAKDGESKV